jgi:hypothetical protein
VKSAIGRVGARANGRGGPTLALSPFETPGSMSGEAQHPMRRALTKKIA